MNLLLCMAPATSIPHDGDVQRGNDARVVEAAAADQVDARLRDQLPPRDGAVVLQHPEDAGRRDDVQRRQRRRRRRGGQRLRLRGRGAGLVLAALCSSWTDGREGQPA